MCEEVTFGIDTSGTPFDAVVEEHTDEEAKAGETRDIEQLFHLALDRSSLLERDEERLLTQQIRAAWQNILHVLEGQPRLIFALLGDKAFKPDSFTEGDIVRVVEGLQARVYQSKRQTAEESSPEELLVLLRSLQEELVRFRRHRDELIRRNLRLVLSIARRHQHRGLGYLDLIQEGVLGLMRAIEKFDPQKGVKFSTYAVWWVWQAMIAAQTEQGGAVIHSSARVENRRRRLSRLSQALEETLHRAPSREELFVAAQEKEKIRSLVFAEQPLTTVSLDAPVGGEDDRLLEETISDPNEPSPEEVVTKEDVEEKLRMKLHHLAPRDAEILRLRFGLAGTPVLTLQEVGNRLGVTKERVRQLEERALVRLKRICEQSGVEAWV
jgi:RNA polymerase sigma factor (sigma-70 family)